MIPNTGVTHVGDPVLPINTTIYHSSLPGGKWYLVMKRMGGPTAAGGIYTDVPEVEHSA